MTSASADEGAFSTEHFSVLGQTLHRNGLLHPMVLAEQTDEDITNVI